MNGMIPIIAPVAAEAKQAMISHLAIGCGDFQTMKYANAISSASPSKNGHLGIFQFVASFITSSFGEISEERKQTPCAFSSTNPAHRKIIRCVRTCVIFNPAARGNKARHFRHHLDEIAANCALKGTAAPGDARRLAAEAVAEGFELIAAAGGDGTLNEVLNGIGDAPDGFARVRLGVLPLGTVNVFARELKIPRRLERAWEVLSRGREIKIDLPRVEFSKNGIRRKMYFAQLAGA